MRSGDLGRWAFGSWGLTPISLMQATNDACHYASHGDDRRVAGTGARAGGMNGLFLTVEL